MKSEKIILALLSLVVVLFVSCDGMNDLHLGYLKRGETIYAAKVDSISPGAGNERIEMEVFIKSQRIEFIRFYWNAYRDSVDFNINDQVGTFKFMIEDLPEGDYLFQVVSYDKYGNNSLPFEVSSPTYGEYYRTYLTNRRIESITQAEDLSLIFRWEDAAEEIVYTTLYFKNNDDEEIVRIIPASVTEDIISDFKPLSEFRYITTYRPLANSPDTFDTNEATGNFPGIVIPEP